MHKYDPCVLYLACDRLCFRSFLLSSVRQLWVTATFLWSSTAGVRTGHRSVPSSCSSSATRPTCGKRCATFGTGSRRARSMPWVRALVQDCSCPTWASVAPPAMWRLRPACLQFSAARAGLRAARPGRSTGHSCFTKRSASAGRIAPLFPQHIFVYIQDYLELSLSLRMFKHFRRFLLDLIYTLLIPKENSRHQWLSGQQKYSIHTLSNIPNRKKN